MKLSKRLLSLLLLLCMTLSLFSGCVGTDNTTDGTEEANKELSIEDILPEDTPLKFTLTEQDLTDLKAMIPSVKEKMLTAETNDAAEAEMKPLEEKFDFIMIQSGVAEVLYYCHQSDKTAMQNYLFAKETLGAAYKALVELEEEIYNANPPYKDEYFDGMTPDELDRLVKQREKETELGVLKSQITTDFYTNPEYEDRTKIDKLYNSYIKMGNDVAKTADFDNFYDYATENMYHRDYGKEQREAFRSYVNRYVIPLLSESGDAFAQSMDKLTYVQQSQLSRLIDTMAYDELDDSYLMGYLNSLTGSTKEGMMHMFEHHNFICASWEDSNAGAFTITLEDPFCYFGPGVYQTTFTVAHELGHYYAELHLEEDQELSFDIAETHSQGNEMLLMKHLETRLDPEVHEALVNYTIYEFVNSIILSTVIDHFEEMVYNNPNSSRFTTKQYDDLMKKVLEQYNLSEEAKEVLLLYWKEVCLTSPVYYISYATSAIAVLNLYGICEQDYKSAMEIYRKLVEEIDEDSDFRGTLKNAGLPTPFEEKAFTSLKELLKK